VVGAETKGPSAPPGVLDPRSGWPVQRRRHASVGRYEEQRNAEYQLDVKGGIRRVRSGNRLEAFFRLEDLDEYQLGVVRDGLARLREEHLR
jgi:hypothetical protein